MLLVEIALHVDVELLWVSMKHSDTCGKQASI